MYRFVCFVCFCMFCMFCEPSIKYVEHFCINHATKRHALRTSTPKLVENSLGKVDGEIVLPLGEVWRYATFPLYRETPRFGPGNPTRNYLIISHRLTSSSLNSTPYAPNNQSTGTLTFIIGECETLIVQILLTNFAPILTAPNITQTKHPHHNFISHLTHQVVRASVFPYFNSFIFTNCTLI